MFNPLCIIFAAAIFFAVHPAFAQPFVHPGGLHSQADFDRMKAKVAANQSPWVDSYNYLTAVGEAQTSWNWAPVVWLTFNRRATSRTVTRVVGRGDSMVALWQMI